MARSRGVQAAVELANELGGKFVNLDDGEVIIAAFAGMIQDGDGEEPLTVEVVWYDTPTGRKAVEYDPAIHERSDVVAQFSWNLFIRDTGNMKILQRGVKFFNKWLSQKNSGHMGHWFEIERVGTGMDTEYRLSLCEEIGEEDLTEIKEQSLLDLDKSAFGGTDDGNSGGKTRKKAPRSRARAAKAAPGGSNGSGNGHVSDVVAGELRQAIKDLPDAEGTMNSFKTKFKVDKLKTLPAGKEDEARRWLAALAQTAVTGPVTNKPAVDPFE